MEWLKGWLTPRTAPVSGVAARGLEAWTALRPQDELSSLEATRFCVLDTETSGLDAERDELLAIGAVEVVAGALGASFEVELRPDRVSAADNVLIHGIGHGRQRGAREPAEALAEFLAFAGRPVFVAHHAAFDAAVVSRALRRHLGVRLSGEWLDAGMLLPALVPDGAPRGRDLDPWLDRFGIACSARHSAAADAHATAQLFLVILARAGAKGITDVRGLRRLQARERARAMPLPGGGA
jgi:DNA polymerase-3 subunit epsilon